MSALLAPLSSATAQVDTARAARARRAVVERVDTALLQRILQLQPLKMPRLTGLDTSRAIATLRSVGIVHYVIGYPRRGTAIDSVVSQYPREDSLVRRLDTVRMTLGWRPLQRTAAVPHVVGQSRGGAAETIAGRRLSPYALETPAPSLDWVGRVVRQAPDSPRSLPIGDTVRFWVATDPRIEMPVVTDRSVSAASALLARLGFTQPIVRPIAGAGEPVDVVVEQWPPARSLVLPTTRVVLTTGRRLVPRMPSVIGLGSAAAIESLAARGIAAYDVRRPPATLVPVDTIAAQYPDPGATLSPGTSAQLTLAGRVRVPYVVGQTGADARSMLGRLGLVPRTRTQSVTSAAESGRVVAQSPDSGVLVPPGRSVALSIGRASAVTTIVHRVPLVVGLDTLSAFRALADSGYRRHRVQLPLSARASDVVFAQTPRGGATAGAADTIVLTLRERQDSVLVPSVVALRVDSASRVLRDAGFRAEVDALGGPALHGREEVRSQSPAGGTLAPPGAVVTIAPSNRLAAIVLIVLLLGGGGIAAYRAFQPPSITPRVSVRPHPGRASTGESGFVHFDVGVRVRAESRRPRLDITGSLLA